MDRNSSYRWLISGILCNILFKPNKFLPDGDVLLNMSSHRKTNMYKRKENTARFIEKFQTEDFHIGGKAANHLVKIKSSTEMQAIEEGCS